MSSTVKKYQKTQLCQRGFEHADCTFFRRISPSTTKMKCPGIGNDVISSSKKVLEKKKRINLGAIVNLKHAHTCVPENSRILGKPNLKKSKHSITFFDQSGVLKNMRSFSLLGICGAYPRVRNPHKYYKVKTFSKATENSSLITQARRIQCVSESHSSPTCSTTGRTVSNYDRQLG